MRTFHANVARWGVLIARDGTERVIADSGAPIIDRDSGVLGVVLVFRDVTQKREVEREMLMASRLESLCLLAGGIAHDFNNLLAGILGYVSLARRASSTGDVAGIDGRLASAEAAVLRAKELTQQLLVISKGGVSTKKPTLPERSPGDLAPPRILPYRVSSQLLRH